MEEKPHDDERKDVVASGIGTEQSMVFWKQLLKQLELQNN